MVFQHGKRVGIVHDEWQDPTCSKQFKDHTGQWRGFTFFKIKGDHEESSKNVESDGSYERIGEEDEW